MAYVTVPKDLDRVKNKVVFNLTVRQVICLGIAAMIGAPFYFATRNILGVSNTILPFIDRFDKSLKLYSLMTTKPDEVKAKERKEQKSRGKGREKSEGDRS